MTERLAFEAWMKALAGYPFAGQFANLMWKAWQARAALDKSSFSHWIDEQEGNGPDAPSVGGKEGSWVELTDEDRDRAFNTLPDMLDGFMKKWGWLHFAKAIEAICREKNGAPQEGAEG